ncbi:MAG: RecX family transcriptional regulator [Butyrivibrio sp.]|nr:RecX family transcriptional regulator [Acetatifactor muris]MCM1560398.1 RecX family transcriptional regulator [Butyrivibrio sp.]
MKVTALEDLSRSRSKVYIDGEFAFVLYRGELHRYHLQVGEEIVQEDYDEIRNQVLPKRAKLRAMNLLAKREYTEKQLYDKLKEGFYPPEIIREALDYVAGFHYTDDLRYACGYIADHEDSRSRRRIEQDLIGKGIDRATLERAWAKWEEQGGSQDEAAMIQALLKKRGYDAEYADIRERQKTYAFLIRKGFSGDAVKKALKADDIDT